MITGDYEYDTGPLKIVRARNFIDKCVDENLKHLPLTESLLKHFGLKQEDQEIDRKIGNHYLAKLIKES